MALATNKRRFYNLLDNLSSSKLNPQTASSTTDRPSKRSRMPHSTNQTTLTAGIQPNSKIIRVLATGSTTKTTRIATNQGIEGGSTYAPWSQDQFLSRLETFADVKRWTTKPEALSDVYWAKRGWIVVELDEVACRSCGKHLMVKIGFDRDKGSELGERTNEDEAAEDVTEQDWWQEGVEQDYVNKYETFIIDGHSQDCLWRKAGCKDDIYRIKFSDPAQWQLELQKRYSTLVNIPSTLPINIVNPFDTQEAKEERADLNTVIEYLKRSAAQAIPSRPTTTSNNSEEASMTSIDATQGPGSDKIRSATIMAVCGWEAQCFSGVHIASCQKCFARVGLWLYTTSVMPSDSTEDDDSMKFDPISLHRTHCPWQNATSQSGLGSYSGHAAWEIVVELLGLEASRVERRRSVRSEKAVVDQANEEDLDEEEETLPVSRASRDETERQDKERETRLARLKRAFSTRHTSKRDSRPKSSLSTTSFLSGRSFHRRDESR